MPTPASSIDLRRAIAAMYRQAGLAQPSGAVVRQYERLGPGALSALRSDLTRQRSTPAASDPVEDITKEFIGQIGSLIPRRSVSITPFDQSGFYSEADARALAKQEYEPFYAREKAYSDRVSAENDRQRLEEVNAAGGYRSSAYAQEMALRREALARAATQMDDEKAQQKHSFVQNRRNEAYQRYLQSIGALQS